MSERFVVIGAVAAGPRAACRAKRLRPDAEVILLDKDDLISYGGCGIPYYVSGDITDEKELRSTTFHMLRDESFFRDAKGVEVLTRTLATSIDRKNKVVHIKYLDSGKEETLAYDKLVLATGSQPFVLPIPGNDLDGVFTIANLHKAIEIKHRLSSGQVEKAVVIGGGAIGLEMSEALADLWGVEVTVLEYMPQVLPRIVDPVMAKMVEAHLREKGLQVVTNSRIKEIKGEAGKVRAVVAEEGVYPADLVIMSVGVRPNSQLAREAGLEIGPFGGIVVNHRLQTSDPDIYAGGDCVENYHLLTGKRFPMPLGSLANKHGRIIGTNLAGGTEIFEGCLGSFVMKVFDLSVAGTGLSLQWARQEGFPAAHALHNQTDRAHFFPGSAIIHLQMVFDPRTQRVLGVQGLGPAGDAVFARVGMAAALIRQKATIADFSSFEVPYAPPFANAMDALNALANVADNIVSGRMRTIEVDEAVDRLYSGDEMALFVDLRHKKEAEPYEARYPGRWIWMAYNDVRRRYQELPGDKDLLLVCNSGMRSYEVQRFLDQVGLKRNWVIHGGMNVLRRQGVDLLK